MNDQILSVSEFNAFVNQTLEFAYPEVVIEGELSSFKINQNKWVFFDLKDSASTVGCFMSVYQLNTPLEDGMLVRVRAQPKLTAWGKFSLTIRSVELAGEGSVKKAFELLRAQLEKEGMFTTERKRPLPEFPKRIGLITSKQAAAYNDFVTILNDRWSGVEVHHLQVQVQGEAAPTQVVEAIEYFNSNADNYDVLVIIRGGGSAEDLQAFQTEPVARAVFGSKIPTLVAIGHEDDISLAELSADVRAATPTDAARLIVPDKTVFLQSIRAKHNLLSEYMQAKVYSKREVLTRFEHSLTTLLQSANTQLTAQENLLVTNLSHVFQISQKQFHELELKMNTLSPQAVLQRGYAVVSQGNVAIHSAKEVKIDSEIMIQLSKGKLRAKILGSL